MHTLLRHVRKFLKEDDGATMAEYVVLMAVIIFGVIGAIRIFTGTLEANFNTHAITVDEAGN